MTKQTEYVVRDSILKLLSEGELARVSNLETAAGLADGEEYIDLEQLEQGVRSAPAKTTPPSRMLLRKAGYLEQDPRRPVDVVTGAMAINSKGA